MRTKRNARRKRLRLIQSRKNRNRNFPSSLPALPPPVPSGLEPGLARLNFGLALRELGLKYIPRNEEWHESVNRSV